MASTRNPRMFRCRLVRFVDGFPQTVIYVGPFDGWSRDWHMVMRAVA